MITIDHLSKRFDGLLALNEISVAIQEYDRVAVIGPNGSGKTTLFNLICGMDKPSSGTIRLHAHPGMDVSGPMAAGLARTFQNPRLFESLNVRQNILAGIAATAWGKGMGRWAALLRPNWHAGARAVAGVLRAAGLEARSEMFVAELSYGQRKLVELSRALASDPRILLLDEPTAGLNRAEAKLLIALLEEVLARRRICLVVIEHDFGFVESLCRRVLVLKQGNLIFDGPPERAKRDGLVLEAYLGTR